MASSLTSVHEILTMRGRYGKAKGSQDKGATILEQQNSYWDKIGKGAKMREVIDIPGFLCSS
jgi:hypothetical protein